MKNVFKLFLVLFVIGFASTAFAGHYFVSNHVLYLNGEVKLRFNRVEFGWAKHSDYADMVKYDVTCLAGKVVLSNVEYLDKAVDGKETVRWAESAGDLGKDFSAKFSHLDKAHRINVGKNNKVKIQPFDMASAKVRFHFKAANRHYKIDWMPKTGTFTSTWEVLK